MSWLDNIASIFKGRSPKDPNENVQPRKPDQPQASLIDPLRTMMAYSGRDAWRSTTYRGVDGVPIALLDRLARLPVVASIIQTRINQVCAVMRPQRDEFSPGLVVRTKAGIKTTTASEKKADEIMRIVMNGGDKWMRGGARAATTALLRDSLGMDHAGFEPLKRKGKVYGWLPIDARTIRIGYPGAEAIDKGLWDPDEVGYIQVMNEKVVAEFTDREFVFCVRRPRTATYSMGYGYPELEELLDTLTALIDIDTYRATQFDRGIQAAWVIVLLSKMGADNFQAFSDQIRALSSGVQGADTVPVVQLDPAQKEDLKAVPLHRTPQDLQYQQQRMAIVQEVCALFSMDPAELGWVIGNEGQASGFSKVPVSERVKASKEKGLVPLCSQFSSWLTWGVVEQIDEDFEVEIVGLNDEDEESRVELDVKKVGSFMTINEIRERYNLEPDEYGDIIPNPFYMQEKSAAMFGDGGDDPQDPGGNGSEDPDDVEKGRRDAIANALADLASASAKRAFNGIVSGG